MTPLFTQFVKLRIPLYPAFLPAIPPAELILILPLFVQLLTELFKHKTPPEVGPLPKYAEQIQPEPTDSVLLFTFDIIFVTDTFDWPAKDDVPF